MKILASLSFVLFSPVLASGGTFLVANGFGPGVDFTSIQDAIDAAQDGDLIVVEGMFRERLVIDGKSLTISGIGSFAAIDDPGFVPGVGPIILVENLDATQSFHMTNITVVNYIGPEADGIRVDNCDGRVWFERTDIFTDRGHGMRVTDSSNVMLSNVNMDPERAHTDVSGTPVPSNGLIVEAGSTVDAYGSRFSGSTGYHFPLTATFPIAGGHGAIVTDSKLQMTDCDLWGGMGESKLVGTCLAAAESGSGLKIRALGGSIPSVSVFGGTITAGLPAQFDPVCAPSPGVALAIDDPAGVLTTKVGTPRLLEMSNQTTPFGAFHLSIFGEPGDQWLLFASAAQVNGEASGSRAPGAWSRGRRGGAVRHLKLVRTGAGN